MERPDDGQISAWYPRLFRTALRMVGSREDASDLTQEVFRKAFRSWETFDGRSQPVTWLHGILVNCARDWARRRSVRRAEPLQEWGLPDGVANASSAHDLLDRKEQLSGLREAIRGLDDKLSSPFVAAVLDGYTYGEVAEMLGIPVGTVGHRVYQARRKIRCQMRELFPEE